MYSLIAYETLLDDLEAYLYENDVYHVDRYKEMKPKLQLLLARANAIIAIHKELTGNLDISPYRASLAMYVNTQLTEVLAIIHPDKVKKKQK
jgi:hypothetical protein